MKCDTSVPEANFSPTLPPSPSGPDRSELITQHRESAFRTARSLVRRAGLECSQEEIQSIADMALCEAASRYQPLAGATFMTYAFYFIKAEVRTVRHRVGAWHTENSAGLGREDDSPSDELGKEVENVASTDARSCPIAMHRLRRVHRTSFSPVESILDEVEQAICIGVYVYEKTMSDLAVQLGYSRGHLFAIRKRAEEKLRDELEEIDYDIAA